MFTTKGWKGDLSAVVSEMRIFTKEQRSVHEGRQMGRFNKRPMMWGKVAVLVYKIQKQCRHRVQFHG